MEVGKIRRLKRIFREDKKTVIVPMDHGVTSGPIKGLENMQETVNKLLKGGVDAIVVHRGIAKLIDARDAGLIVHLSGSTSLSPDPNRKVQVCSVEEAIRIGADAVSIHVNVGADYESEMLMKFGKIADECDRFGIPLLAMMYPRGAKIQNEHALEVVAHASRLGAELGADIIKTNYTGSIESFKEVVKKCPVPIIIAGGPKTKNEEEFLQMVYDAIQAGAVGVSIGRNVFQSENPTLMVKALSAIVHKRFSVAEAMKILGSGK
jgi:fructose-bisphosphate aldolase/2-amino-3,7-dideoxy-D-threo-hept-6-ulosonate synthase